MLAAGAGEVVALFFHRHDPSVEQRLRVDALTTQIVDEQQPVVRLHLQRRSELVRARVAAQFEHLGGSSPPLTITGRSHCT